MFDLTDDVENSPYSTKKAKPAEVKILLKKSDVQKKEVPKNDDYNEYEYDDRDPIKDKTLDDSEW